MRIRLASGDWVDEARVRLVCLMLLGATLTTLAVLLATAHGTLDLEGRPIGTDFSDVYAAGWMADHGSAAATWVWPEHYRTQQAIHHSATVPFYGWHYPPPFLLIASILALLPYLPALALWQGSTLTAATIAARHILPGRGTTMAVLAAPATFVCLSHGQNAFMTASLLGGGLWLLDRRPVVAGLLLGCLVYKPQFAVLLPIVLIVAGNPKAIFGAACSSLTLVATTLAIWGYPVWDAFRESLPLTQHVVIESGNTGWEKITSAFAAVRALGAPLPIAYVVQGTVSAFTIIGAAIAGRWASPEVRGAAVCSAALLSTPYALDYDLVILGAAILFIIADARGRSWLNWEKSALAFAYIVPLCGRQLAALTLVPLNWLAIVTIFALTLRRAWVFDLASQIATLPIRSLLLRSSPSRR